MTGWENLGTPEKHPFPLEGEKKKVTSLYFLGFWCKLFSMEHKAMGSDLLWQFWAGFIHAFWSKSVSFPFFFFFFFLQILLLCFSKARLEFWLSHVSEVFYSQKIKYTELLALIKNNHYSLTKEFVFNY